MKTLRTSFIVLALLLVALMPVLANGAKEALAEEDAKAATEATAAVAETVAAEAAPVATVAYPVANAMPAYGEVNKDDMYSAFNFAYGYYITGQLVDQGVSFNSAYYFRGLLDGYLYGEKDSLIDPAEMETVVNEYVSTFYSQGMTEEPGDVLTLEEVEALEAPDTLVEKFSYAYAYMNMVQLYLYNGLDILPNEFVQGSAYAMYYLEPDFMSFEEMQNAINAYADMLDAEYEEYQANLAEYNLTTANQFMEANKTAEGVVVINDFVQLQVVDNADALEVSPTSTDSVIVDYALYTIDGSMVDSGEDVTFSLTSLIPGFTEGVTNMHVGEEALIYIHPDHGYGANDLGNIGPNSLLIFDVILKGIAL